MSAPPPPKKSGLSLYADLLTPDNNGSAGATISSAPVRYNLSKSEDDGDAAAAVQKRKDASLKFQPIKRPQVQAKKNVKPSWPSAGQKLASNGAAMPTSSLDQRTLSTVSKQPPAFQRSNFEDWLGDEEEDDEWTSRQRQQRKNKKQKKKHQQQDRLWDWADIYDPTMPNNYADYKGSEEQVREIRDWKARLYYHELKRARKNGKQGAATSDEDDGPKRPINPMFAPPANLNFAPPPILDDTASYAQDMANNLANSDTYISNHDPRESSPPLNRSWETDHATGEEVFQRRMRLGEADTRQPPAFSNKVESPSEQLSTTVRPAIGDPVSDDIAAKRAAAQAKIAAFKAKLGQQPSTVSANASADPAPLAVAAMQSIATQNTENDIPPPPPPSPPPAGPTISRSAVRYDTAAASHSPHSNTATLDTLSSDHGSEHSADAERPRSNRPGQKGFAERLLNKYGWEKGQGLGAQGEGITTAIVAKADKRKKRADADGGGYATPANMGKIVGGKRRKVEGADAEQQDSRYGAMSEVIKVDGMLTGLDVAREIEDNNLMQQIGDQIGPKYGNVERLFIWREAAGGRNEVFVKFTSALSALRAVNAADGMAFKGNTAAARFFDAEKFERGDYE